MWDFFFSANILVHFAFAFYALGFMVRDELRLRLLVFVGTICYILYYWFISDKPLWDAIVTSVILGSINVWMIIVILMERTTFAMSQEMRQAYEQFPNLNPGQFRRVIRTAKLRKAKTDIDLTEQNVSGGRLFLVLNGQIELEKDLIQTTTEGPMFIGEIGFLTHSAASASVRVAKSTDYFEWECDELRRIMDRKVAINNAITALFSKDLAQKLERSVPKVSVLNGPKPVLAL